MCKRYCAVLWVLNCLGGGTRAIDQVERAGIVGTIRDSTGSVVPSVAVKLINQATNATENLQTDSAGDYSATNLTPGTYLVEAEKSGFTRRVYRDFVVQVAQVARLDITLAVGAVEQTVDKTPLLQTENASVGHVISSPHIGELPLNGRNFAQPAILAPALPVSPMRKLARSTGARGRMNCALAAPTLEANGARDSSNQLLTDGVRPDLHRPALPSMACRSSRCSPTTPALSSAEPAEPSL